ncbi:unnamed protein product [Hyaloperonospora brassicae]|uniref:Auto-transporter adhesin head GIN domain-containing protein n=1 Tax=Hyaloperonospora brassicae TaxID=162125 RepID=A0AAV0TKK7_HYABA|nr:unnamed protein product [Hyaloperonospora brassicae]
MRTSGWQVCVIAASVFSTIALADFKVDGDRTTRSEMNSRYANYAKSWTLSSSDATEIESLDLSLAGTVYVSYSSDIPSDVVGYVNVTGNTKTIVEAVTVTNEVNGLLPDLTSLDDVFGDTKKQLSVSLDNDVTHGHLLTEIFLSNRRKVTKIATRRTADVVVTNDVLLTRSSTRGQKISVTGMSTLYVSMPNAAVKVREIDALVTGGGRMQYRAKSLDLWQKLELEASGDTSIKMLCPVVIAGKLELESESQDSEICLSAHKVKAALPEVTGKRSVSMPNYGDGLGAHGTSACSLSKAPPREPSEFTPVPKRKQEDLKEAEASAAADEKEEEEEAATGSGDVGKDVEVYKALVSSYNETDVAADEETYETDDKDTDGRKNDRDQDNVDPLKAFDDAKNNLVNETTNAIDNGKKAVMGGAKKAIMDATGNLLGN